MTRPVMFGVWIGGFALAAYAWILAGIYPVAIALLVLSPLSLYTVKRKWRWAPGLTFAALTLSAAFSVWRQAPILPPLLTILLATGAWDLADFSKRLAFASPEDLPENIERQHLLRLAGILALGGLFTVTVYNIDITLNFDRLLPLILLSVAGLGLLVAAMRLRD